MAIDISMIVKGTNTSPPLSSIFSHMLGEVSAIPPCPVLVCSAAACEYEQRLCRNQALLKGFSLLRRGSFADVTATPWFSRRPEAIMSIRPLRLCSSCQTQNLWLCDVKKKRFQKRCILFSLTYPYVQNAA